MSTRLLSRPSARFRHRNAVPLVGLLLLVGLSACGNDEAAGPQPSIRTTSTTPPATVSCVPPVIGHRGEPDAAPEQTIASFEAAIDHGATTIEADIQFTADNVPVLLHGDTLERTTDGTGPLSELSAAEVAALDAGSWESERWTGLRVPTLDEFLLLARDHDVDVIVELKKPGTSEAEVELVLDALTDRKMADRAIIQSLVPADLALVRKIDPSAQTALITAVATPPDEALASGQMIIAKQAAATAAQVEAWHQAGLKVVVWTPNDEAAWELARAADVDGVMTDRTEAYQRWARQMCGEDESDAASVKPS